MDDEKKAKRESCLEMSSDSSWGCSGYFFDDADHENSILSEFGWNLHKQSGNNEHTHHSFMELDHQGSFILPENTCSTPTLPATMKVEKSSSTAGDAASAVVSSSSSDEQPEKSTGSDEKPPDKPVKGSRKKGQKRTRQQRFAFMTKSDVDHLEDGYRWRKYGQKAVKNSPYPRSYYRCTNSKCTVKKRVERSCEDNTVVITTYEGQHCHHTVSFPRGGIFSHEFPFISGINPSASQVYSPTVQYPIGGRQFSVSQLNPVLQHETRPNQVHPEPNTQNAGDEGLLGDIVPPRMRNG